MVENLRQIFELKNNYLSYMELTNQDPYKCENCERDARQIGDGSTYVKRHCSLDVLCYDCAMIGHHDCRGDVLKASKEFFCYSCGRKFEGKNRKQIMQFVEAHISGDYHLEYINKQFKIIIMEGNWKPPTDPILVSGSYSPFHLMRL